MTLRDKASQAEIAPIILTLEAQLSHLDRIGAYLAAAHVDAAINRLRVDFSLGHEESKPPQPRHR